MIRKAAIRTKGGSIPSSMDADSQRRILASNNFGVKCTGMLQVYAGQISLVDASNAFNSLDRQSFLHNISYLFPSIAIFVKSCHSTPSRPDGDGGVL